MTRTLATCALDIGLIADRLRRPPTRRAGADCEDRDALAHELDEIAADLRDIERRSPAGSARRGTTSAEIRHAGRPAGDNTLAIKVFGGHQ